MELELFSAWNKPSGGGKPPPFRLARIAQKLLTFGTKVVNICKAKFVEERIVITLNQEEIQLACKRFVKEHYNLDLPDPENPAHGIQLKVITNDWMPGTARVEADVEIKQ